MTTELTKAAQTEREACTWCCGTGRFADHGCRFCRGTGRASLPAPQQATPEWLHLKPHGYAPGNYMNKCLRCGQTPADLDKRATSCRPCAEAAYAAQQATPEPVGEVKAVARVPSGVAGFMVDVLGAVLDQNKVKPGDKLYTRPAPGVPEDVADLLCSVADNLNDMPISDDYAAKTAKTAYDLLVKYKVINALAAAQAKGVV